MWAGYYLDVTKPEQFLSITPFGWQGASEEFDTRIDLPITTPHEDTVRITYSYVFDPSMSRGLSKVELASGRVTITGTPVK